jgi:hypothetical protein
VAADSGIPSGRVYNAVGPERLQSSLDMKTKLDALVLLSLLVASCVGGRTRSSAEQDPSWISEEQAQSLCNDFLRHNGNTNGEALAVIRGGELYGCIFSSGDTNPTVKVLVNRKTREVRYGDSRP